MPVEMSSQPSTAVPAGFAASPASSPPPCLAIPELLGHSDKPAAGGDCVLDDSVPAGLTALLASPPPSRPATPGEVELAQSYHPEESAVGDDCDNTKPLEASETVEDLAPLPAGSPAGLSEPNWAAATATRPAALSAGAYDSGRVMRERQARKRRNRLEREAAWALLATSSTTSPQATAAPDEWPLSDRVWIHPDAAHLFRRL